VTIDIAVAQLAFHSPRLRHACCTMDSAECIQPAHGEAAEAAEAAEAKHSDMSSQAVSPETELKLKLLIAV
jgi:hypothetical protein